MFLLIIYSSFCIDHHATHATQANRNENMLNKGAYASVDKKQTGLALEQVGTCF